tara:strand:- start:438 stop:644 length:207 start_codon:yes stop_codon:yes gene_type:complete
MKNSLVLNLTPIGYQKKDFINEFFKLIINILNDIRIKLWDTQKNTEEDEKLALKKEELEKEIRKDSLS